MPPIQPVRIDTSQEVEEKREPIFYIDDTEYTIPVKIPARMTVKYLNDVYEHGEEYAIASSMRDILGGDAMEALAECEHVGDEQMEQIMAVVEKKLMASAKKTTGKSSRGPRK